MKLKSPCIDACRIDTRTNWCTGHPAEQIIYYAENNDIDHIVMGHRGNTFFHRLLLGSVAKQVSHDLCSLRYNYSKMMNYLYELSWQKLALQSSKSSSNEKYSSEN
ncbi:MAG: universal stress protein [Candidatus Berkiella sp.]